VRGSTLREAESLTAEQLMEPGPPTIRADERIEALRERMEAGGLTASVVTTPDGTLLGIVRREDIDPGGLKPSEGGPMLVGCLADVREPDRSSSRAIHEVVAMSTELIEKARSGLEAWQRGDVEALAPLLHPEVELTWWEPGEWDCHGREAVLALLRERAGEGVGAAKIELIDAAEDMIVATRAAIVPDGPAAGLRPATLITFRDGKAITMRQFRDRSEALATAR
jgi:ketosteroid isomerase-like protein